LLLQQSKAAHAANKNVMARKKKAPPKEKDSKGEAAPGGDGDESSGLESDNEYELLVEAEELARKANRAT
jgi:hypothetical protein